MEAAVAIWMMMMMRMCGKQKREEATAALHRTRWSRKAGCACFNHHGDEGGGGGGHHLLIPLHHQKRKEAALHRMRRGESGLAPGRGEEVTRVEVPTTWLWLRPELAGRWSPVGEGGDGGGSSSFEEKLEGHWVASVVPPCSPCRGLEGGRGSGLTPP